TPKLYDDGLQSPTTWAVKNTLAESAQCLVGPVAPTAGCGTSECVPPEPKRDTSEPFSFVPPTLPGTTDKRFPPNPPTSAPTENKSMRRTTEFHPKVLNGSRRTDLRHVCRAFV